MVEYTTYNHQIQRFLNALQKVDNNAIIQRIVKQTYKQMKLSTKFENPLKPRGHHLWLNI